VGRPLRDSLLRGWISLLKGGRPHLYDAGSSARDDIYRGRWSLKSALQVLDLALEAIRFRYLPCAW
jgi:hypothetical protein